MVRINSSDSGLLSRSTMLAVAEKSPLPPNAPTITASSATGRASDSKSAWRSRT